MFAQAFELATIALGDWAYYRIWLALFLTNKELTSIVLERIDKSLLIVYPEFSLAYSIFPPRVLIVEFKNSSILSIVFSEESITNVFIFYGEGSICNFPLTAEDVEITNLSQVSATFSNLVSMEKTIWF